MQESLENQEIYLGTSEKYENFCGDIMEYLAQLLC
jgi:hypothetical protein